MKHYKITEITEWDVNHPFIQADADHGGVDYHVALGEAHSAVKSEMAFGGIDLPFECEAESEEDALAKYAEKYADELVIPTKAEIKELHKFTVSLQVDTRIDIDVYAENAKEAAWEAENANFDMKDLEYIESHPVNAYDHETDKLIDLY